MEVNDQVNENLELVSQIPKLFDGKDELNLAEFPLSAIADRLDPDQKTLTFQDEVWDNSRGEMVTRQLTVAASDQYGLPTALDDEVILGLVQLSKIKDFTNRQVSFTRYQLIQILGWRNESKSYERVEKSLNRWVGVTLYYENAWWSKQDLCWVDEKFHILDNVTLYEREKARKQPSCQPQLPLSTFTWNETIFKSFRAGNLKSIDFDFYKSLKSSVAKRLYRFLDKRFFHRQRYEFNLKEFSWEHVGISRNYDAANIKRKLLPGIRELESKGFLQPMSDGERFRKVRSGEWRMNIEKARSSVSPKAETQRDGMRFLLQALIERGVTPSTAQQIIASCSADRIQTQLEVFDWMLAQKNSKMSRNPAGFLVSSIKSEYEPPKGFVSSREQARRKTQAEERKGRDQAKAQERAAKEEAKRLGRQSIVERFWQSFSENEKLRLEMEAVAGATELERGIMERGGAFAASTRQGLLEIYALKSLQEGG